jgi:hypothetical protein
MVYRFSMPRPDECNANDASKIPQTVLEEHLQKQHPDLDGKALGVHLLVHQLVEKQLVEKDPPEVSDALLFLISQGLDRHEAVHKIGKVVTKEALAMLQTGRALDKTKYVRELKALMVPLPAASPKKRKKKRS